MPDGRIEKLRLGNGLWERAKFNSRLQVTELAIGHGVSNGDLWKLGYEYGEIDGNGNLDIAKNTGNVARQTLSFAGLTNPFVQTYKYDSLYRLTEAREISNGAQTWKQGFSYDRYGNRITNEKFSGSNLVTQTNVTHPTIDENTNRFTSGQGYVFDKNGNLTTDAENRTFVFNGDNKQKEIRDSSNNLVGEYFYDGEGKRVKKKTYDNGVLEETTVFVYSSGKLIAEYSSKPPAQNPTTSFTITDQLGSPRVLVNSLGEVVSRRDFLPFGEEIVPDTANLRTDAALKYNTDGVRQKFTGYQKDEESGLDFAEARMYENRHGRFTAVDPLLASGTSANPQTFNRYVYVLNNPLMLTDPSGLQAGDYAGPVYANANETTFSKSPGTGRQIYEKFRVEDAEDGYRYYITPNGWNQLGKTSDLIENDISDLQSVEVGLKRWVNQFFDIPLDVSPLHSNPNLYPSIRDLTGFQPFSDAEVETKTWRDWGIATATQIGVDALAAKGVGKLAEAAELSSIGGLRPSPFSSFENFRTGTFSISDWTGYPENYVRPNGPFRILQGEEYKISRSIANKTNRGLHIEDPGLKGSHIHEIHPVKFGGSPTDISNKLPLTPQQHHRFNVFWKTLQRSIELK